MYAKDLTQEQREEFQNHFYGLEDSSEDYLTNASCIWGCPWDWGGNIKLEGDTIKEMAENLHKDYEREKPILKYIYFHPLIEDEDKIMIENIRSLISGSDYLPHETEVELFEAIGRLTLTDEQARHTIKTFLNSTSTQ